MKTITTLCKIENTQKLTGKINDNKSTKVDTVFYHYFSLNSSQSDIKNSLLHINEMG